MHHEHLSYGSSGITSISIKDDVSDQFYGPKIGFCVAPDAFWSDPAANAIVSGECVRSFLSACVAFQVFHPSSWIGCEHVN
jgi:hypothetical protein